MRDGLAPFLPRYAALDALAGQPVTHARRRGELRRHRAGTGRRWRRCACAWTTAASNAVPCRRSQRAPQVQGNWRGMSAWLFDLGNTRLKCAPLMPMAARAKRSRCRIARTTSLRRWPRRCRRAIDVAYLASVANRGLRVALLDALAARCAAHLAGAHAGRASARCASPMRSRTSSASTGSWRCWPLHARVRRCRLVCGVGTALTIDLIDATAATSAAASHRRRR